MNPPSIQTAWTDQAGIAHDRSQIYKTLERQLKLGAVKRMIVNILEAIFITCRFVGLLPH